MQMVAASKMKKAQERAVSGKPYAEKISEAVKELSSRTNPENHPLLKRDIKTGKTLIILISTNKGLCGGLNTNLFRTLVSGFSEKTNTEFITLGKKGEHFVAATGRSLIADFSDTVPFTQSVPALTSLVVDGFIKENYKEVYLVYNNFISALRQVPIQKKLLPLGMFEEDSRSEKSNFSEFMIEPSESEVLNALLPSYIENQIRAGVLEAEASEQSARMIAMKNATDSAIDLMTDLTLEYNKARQEKITYEIADIVTARIAVE